jgi:hypothetical protein
VVASGSSVTVEQGMGTTVAEGEPPAPPEALLPAPVSVQPASGSEWPASDTLFTWQPVPGAVSYTLEVCTDPDCASLVARFSDIAGESQASSELPIARHYWRVTARSPSSLDGYPSPTVQFSTLEQPKDLAPPEIRVEITGRQLRQEETLYTGPGFAVSVQVEDADSGVESWWPIIDGQVAEVADLSQTWVAGRHRVEIEAVDKAGNSDRSQPISFTFDPDPPVLSWGLLEGLRQGSVQGLIPAGEEPVVPTQRWRRPLRTLSWSGPARQWLQLGSQEWSLESSGPPTLNLRPMKRRMRLSVGRERGSESLLITRKRPLWLRAEDAACGVEALRYRYLEPNPDTVPKADGDLPQEGLLIIEAVDRLGNLTRVEWPAWRAWFVD